MATLGLRDHKYDEFSAATAMELLKMEVEMSSSSPNKTVSLLRKSSSLEKNSSTLLSKKTRRGLIVVSVTLSIFAFLSWYYITQHGRMSIRQIGHAQFNPIGRELQITDQDGETVLTLELGLYLPMDAYPMECEEYAKRNVICIDWLKGSQETELLASMEITSALEEAEAIITVQISWSSQGVDAPLEDCVYMGDDHWYGGAVVPPVEYPVEEMEIPMQPFISGLPTDKGDRFQQDQPILAAERLWLSSAGLAISVNEDVPLQISSNDNNSQRLCFKSEVINVPYLNPLPDYPILLYTIFVSHNISNAHEFTAGKVFTNPMNAPSLEVFSTPIWHIDPAPNITGQALLDFAITLNHSGFHVGEIQTSLPVDFGDSTISMDALNSLERQPPDILEIVSSYNWSVSASPYFNVNSEAFQELASMDSLITDSSGKVPVLMKWRGFYAGILDVTKMEAGNWFYHKLQNFRQSVEMVDSFVFDGGYGADMPPSFASEVPFHNPDSFCTYYTELANRLGKSGRRRCTHRSQSSPLFIQMEPWGANWHADEGLQGIIPSMVQYGLLGYPFVIPPSVCGVVDSGEDTHHPLLDRELYIRWLQLIAYLPAMPFYVMPWEFGPEVASYAREMIELHREKVSPIMRKLAVDALRDGKPIIRPIWWSAPKDEDALTMDSEFLIGDDMLVAPIVQKGAHMRDVYLPAGRWEDNLKGGIIEGGAWLINYEISLWEVGTFNRQK